MSDRAAQIILAAVLLNLAIIAIAGYAIEGSREPIGVVFLTEAGPVPFNHEAHAVPGAPGMDCADCHHKLQGDATGEVSCRACHYYGKEPHRCETAKVHKRCIGAACVKCHVDKECGFCHK